ncbi:MAG: hypothetical protein GY717_12190 [Rhodobacteraceae bacterium]|nr:hypothetical protein [Paracoccaceae bacterium]
MRVLAIFLAALLALPAPLAAQNLLESYTALLSTNDHYNSKGVRLNAVWQILRQDRANYHRFGTGDAQDGWDSFFGSMQNRAKAEQWLMNGYIDPNTARYIVNNVVTVEVEIWGYGTTGTSLRVTAY